MDKQSLQNLTILVTRPMPAGEKWCQSIEAAGARAVFFPTMAILPPLDPSIMQEQLGLLRCYDCLIFTSPQAVYHSSAAIRIFWEKAPTHPMLAAIGLGTVNALLEAQFAVDVYPSLDWSSEGLLACDAFQTIQGKKIAIIKGEGGRTLLKNELAHRGAQVTEINVYRRTIPNVSPDVPQEMIKANQIDAIIVTSNEMITHLKVLLGESVFTIMKDIPLIVISDRMQSYAKELGFKQIFLAKNASLNAMIDFLSVYKDLLCKLRQKRQ